MQGLLLMNCIHKIRDYCKYMQHCGDRCVSNSTKPPTPGLNYKTRNKTRMWANTQRDGRPAKHRWCPLFNVAKFGSRPLLDCRAVTLPRRESR